MASSASSCSRTQRGQGLSGVGTRIPDGERDKDKDKYKERGRTRESVEHNNVRSTSDGGTRKLIQLLLLLF